VTVAYSDLTDKVIVLTGGAGLLGSCLVSLLTVQNSTVVVVDVSQSALDKLSESLPQSARNMVSMICADISTPTVPMEIVKTCLDRHGRIDVLINNAASKSDNVTDFFTSDEDFAAETWRAVLATNLDGAFFMSQAAGREMLRQGHGNIVNIASIYGIVGPDQRLYDGSEYLGHQISTPAAYSASKAGLLGLTRHLATVWGPRGVRVNAVTPGGIESSQNSRFQKNYGSKVPLGRMATSTDIASSIMFLLSDESRYINGHNLIVDGGFSVW
jgi:NAD(P)-dependent dehydrogenase (short-subunit alcohol dehydrogenase family)